MEKADAILVLSGSSVYIERTHKAASLYKKGVAPKVLLTDDRGRAGWSEREKRNPPFVELAIRELIAQGVPEDAIEVLPDEVTGTEWEAKALAGRIKEENLNSVLIVTSAYHTRRALWIFRQVLNENGVNAEIGIAHAPTGEQTPPPFYWWLKPFGWNVVAGEYVKGAAYWVYY
ncbi:MAG TPA: YdcF family protein [Pyrinomonadaceae bacterium]|nr:YdcF family protein [Pyrinomonadaceae bacterium]